MKKILITGGAGFIGSHLVDKLIKEGHDVTVIDSLEPQVHHGKVPDYLNKGCKYIWGNCLDRDLLRNEMKNTQVVYHLASLVGVGQSMYEIERYTKNNSYSPALILEEIINNKKNIEKIIVASSMSIYGEGAYKNEKGELRFPAIRKKNQLENKIWNFYESENSEPLTSIPTSEDKPLYPTSIYAIGKRDQEEMFHVIGNAYNIPSVALRFFNVYGSRQDLNNPYTGVAAIFCSRLLKNLPPIIFEDGEQSRDFVHVSDIINGLFLSLINKDADHETFNLGSGEQISISKVAETLSKNITNGVIKPEYPGNYRVGDVRHCFADISKAEKILGYKPAYKFNDGVSELITWVKNQTLLADKLNEAIDLSKGHGIIR